MASSISNSIPSCGAHVTASVACLLPPAVAEIEGNEQGKRTAKTVGDVTTNLIYSTANVVPFSVYVCVCLQCE